MAGMNDATANGGPPPSTLAAQLVGNISTTTRSSRPDETSELKRLFEAIETVKNDPDCLKTPAERVEHNHTLIYVYARVVLEGLKWDDPFADREKLKEEALKAIQFLKVTIQETPTVLSYETDNTMLLYRGQEPLWVWLFPKLLRMLGHPQCLVLSDPIQSLFHFILDVASRSGGLWNSCGLMYGYLQANFRCKNPRCCCQAHTLNCWTAILAHLKYNDPAFRTTIDLELPEDKVLGLVSLGSDAIKGAHACSYSITCIEHLIRQAACLINILLTIAVSQMSPGRQILCLTEHIPWLVDSLEELNEEQKRWRHHCQYSPFIFLKLALNLAGSQSSPLHDLVSQKLYTIVVLMTADLAEQSEELTGTKQNAKSAINTLALSLAHLAGAMIRKRPIAKIVAAKLLKPLEHISVESGISDDTGDLAVRRPPALLLIPSDSYLLSSVPSVFFKKLQASLSIATSAQRLCRMHLSTPRYAPG